MLKDANDNIIWTRDKITAPPNSAVSSIKDYGAAGDGVTDDTAAYTKAVTAINAAGGGGDVTYPPGSYKINGVVRHGGVRYIDASFPSTLKEQARSFLRGDVQAANGEGVNAVQALAINGTMLGSTLTNFQATATPDLVAVSGWGLRGNQTGGVGTNSMVVANFGAWFENNTNIVWAQEIDVNNEGAT